MARPGITLSITDGALGLASASAFGTHAKVGMCTMGAFNTLYRFSDPQVLKATLGTGPLVEATADTLSSAGGEVLCMRINGSTAASTGSVTATGTGTGTVTVSGTAYDAYAAVVKLTRGGTNIAANTAAFVYSLDGGDTWSAEIAVPTGGVYALPDSGLTITFVNGSGTSFVIGDTHTFSTVAPGYTAGELNTTLDALRADPTLWGWVHVVGAASAAAGSATIASAVASQMQSAENQFRYAFAIVEAADDTDANLKTAFANFVSTRVVVAAGYAEVTSSLTARVSKRHAAWKIATRLAQQSVQRDGARTRDDKEGGALENVVSLVRDERTATVSLDAERFATLRTFVGQPGFFITNVRLMASPASDYQYIQFRRVMDLACALCYAALFPYLNGDDYRVDEVTGYINEVDARAIEAVVEAQMATELTNKNRVTALQVHIKRDQNILSTLTLSTKIRLIPRGYAKFIEVDIGFLNPALQPKAA